MYFGHVPIPSRPVTGGARLGRLSRASEGGAVEEGVRGRVAIIAASQRAKIQIRIAASKDTGSAVIEWHMNLGFVG